MSEADSCADDARPLSARQAFEAMRLYLDAYRERGHRSSDDLAILLGDIDSDPAQWDDWLQAVSKVESAT